MQFVNEVIPEIHSDTELNDMLRLFWPVIYRFNTNSLIRSCNHEEALQLAGVDWLKGESFTSILPSFGHARFGRRKATIDHIVDMCENGFGYQGSMIIGACLDLLGENGIGDPSIKQRLRFFQKAVKYGLPTKEAIAAYEIGMTERSLAMKLARLIPSIPLKRNIIGSFRRNIHEVREIVATYPSYFEVKLEEILG